MARRTKQDALATREWLLDTAEQVFLARGLLRSSLQDIALAAGLSRGAIYWHFTDKLALFEAMMDRVNLPLEQALAAAERQLTSAAANGTPIDPLGVLRTLALEPFALMQRDPRAARVFTILMHRAEFVGDLATLAQRQDGALRDCGLLLQRLFQAASEQGSLASGQQPGHAATALMALIDGLLRLATLGDGMANVLPAVAPAIDALLAGLRAAPQPLAHPQQGMSGL